MFYEFKIYNWVNQSVNQSAFLLLIKKKKISIPIKSAMSNYCHFLCSLTCLDQNVLYFLFLVNLSIKSTHQEGNLSIHQEGNLPEGLLSNILSNLIMIFFQKVKRKVSFIEDRS